VRVLKSILYTKLLRPKVRKNNIKRAQLDAKIAELLNYKLTVISGSAAVGKSTLMSSYLEESKVSNTWISLDEGCDDLTAFWNYLIEALSGHLINKKLYLDMLNPLVNREEIFNLLASLLNELLTIEDLIVVLDDFHYLKDAFLLSTIEFFIKNLSDNIYVIFLTRENLPLYLGDMMASGKVLLINAEEFKLSEKEANDFVKNTLRLNLDNEVVNRIYCATEGWIGGIQLLSMAIKDLEKIKEVPKVNKYIVDYLTKEIMDNLEEEEKELLIKTCCLPYFTPSLCDSILNKDNSKRIIEHLIEKNILIISINEEMGLYRYHNILKEYLLKRFNDISLKEQSEVLDLAGNYFVNIGNIDEALELYILGKDYKKAIELIKIHGHKIVNLKLITRIPNSYLDKSIDLTTFKIFYYYSMLDLVNCQEVLHCVRHKFNSKGWRHLRVFMMLVDDFDVLYEDMDLNIADLNELNTFSKNLIYLVSSIWDSYCGNLNKAIEEINLCLNNNKILNNLYIQIYVLLMKCTVLEEMGSLSKSLESFNNLKDILEGNNSLTSYKFFNYLAVAGVYVKRMNLTEAKKSIEIAVESNREILTDKYFRSGDRGVKYNLAEIEVLEGRIDEGEKLINQLIEEYKGTKIYSFMIALKINTLTTDKITLDELKEYSEICSKLYNVNKMKVEEKLAYSKAVNLLGDTCKGNMILDELLTYCRKNGSLYVLIEGLVYKAIQLEGHSGSEREIKNILREAIFYSKKDMILKPYVLYGKEISNLANKYLIDGEITKDEREFINKINSLFYKEDSEECLSKREIEVLKEIEKGISNKEIAENLFISLATVKTHIIKIYSKLGVNNRVEAINEGKKLNYI
jgi:ATP-dependent transcriptional regulator